MEGDMITGTELRVLRQNCGLTQEDVAEYIGCGLRSVKRWEAGKSRIPQRVYYNLIRLRIRILTDESALILSFVSERTEPIALILYDEEDVDLCGRQFDGNIPFNAFRYVVISTFNDLRRDGYSPRLVRFDRDDYFAFLDGREDTDYLRAKWAEIQITKDKAP